jgi:hypothetical protein
MQIRSQTLPRVGVGMSASGKLGLLPPPLARRTRVYPSSATLLAAEVGNIRLRLEGWGGGEHVR